VLLFLPLLVSGASLIHALVSSTQMRCKPATQNMYDLVLLLCVATIGGIWNFTYVQIRFIDLRNIVLYSFKFGHELQLSACQK
jgi:hypothetical protein